MQITDQPRKVLSVKSDKLRMDSTQIASHIYKYSRIELLVEILQRVHRMLNESDRDRLRELLTPYVESDAHSPEATFHRKRDEKYRGYAAYTAIWLNLRPLGPLTAGV